MICSFEDLFKPIEPPRACDTVLPAHETLKAELRRAGGLLCAMASMADAAPFADDAFDDLDQLASQALRAASVALQCFRASRDCAGSG